MFYLAYLDEFGHDGPYVSRHHARFNTSPVFGLGGMILPVEQVRPFATWFYQLKCRLFEREIRLGQREPYRWEKKGADVFKPKNVHRYASIRSAGHRILNRIRRSGGYVFYVGMEKSADPDQHDAKRLYKAVLRETVKRLDQFCEGRDAHLLLMMDEHGFRRDIVATASAECSGNGVVIWWSRQYRWKVISIRRCSVPTGSAVCCPDVMPMRVIRRLSRIIIRFITGTRCIFVRWQ